MTHWFATPLVAALVLAGCGQTATEAEPPEADPLANDCALAAELATNSKGAELYEAQEFAARAWPQAGDSDLKVIIKSISDAGGLERRYQVNLAFQSLQGWQIANCPD